MKNKLSLIAGIMTIFLLLFSGCLTAPNDPRNMAGFPQFEHADTLGRIDTDLQYKFAPTNWALDYFFYDIDWFRHAKYFVVASKNGGSRGAHNPAGFDGMQFALQGDAPNNYNAILLDMGPFTRFPHDADEIVYFVIDISAFGLEYTDVVQFYFNWIGSMEVLGDFAAYITNMDLSARPADAVNLIDAERPAIGAAAAIAEDGEDAEGAAQTGLVFGYMTKNVNLMLKQ